MHAGVWRRMANATGGVSCKKRILPGVCLEGEPIGLLTRIRCRPRRKGIPSEPRIPKVHGTRKEEAVTGSAKKAATGAATTREQRRRRGNGDDEGAATTTTALAQAPQLEHVSPNGGNREPFRRQAPRPHVLLGASFGRACVLAPTQSGDRGSTGGRAVGRLSQAAGEIHPFVNLSQHRGYLLNEAPSVISGLGQSRRIYKFGGTFPQTL